MFCPRFRGPLRRLACALAIGTGVVAQSAIEPTNSAPNPYQTIEGWAKLPAPYWVIGSDCGKPQSQAGARRSAREA